MINSISIQNFKSIVNASVTLGKLTVIVGANASGKSNLIRALDFLSIISRSGLSAAASKYGGFEAIIPKAITRSAVERTKISFNYRITHAHPSSYPIGQIESPYVEHSLQIASSVTDIIRVSKERLTFHQVLPIASAIALSIDAPDEDDIQGEPIIRPSSFTLIRGPRQGVRWLADPPVYEAMDLYLTWLGHYYMRGQISSKKELAAFLDYRVQGDDIDARRRPKIGRSQSLVDPDARTIIGAASHHRAFRNALSHILRFDLLLGELREDQSVSDQLSLTSDGNNMPSVVRNVRTIPSSRESYQRILSTLGEIAPYVDAFSTGSLRTGREFVEFIEQVASRPVESWESADGTLRALAILLALETTPLGSTILIEEPEQNLHPWAIRSIVDHVREAIELRNLQVILTTHSPQILERLNPEELLIAQRTPEEGTVFLTLPEALPQSDIAMGEVADLWVRGLLGGVP